MSEARRATLRLLGDDPQSSALCCDFDGTIAPIVDDPSRSAPLAGAPEALTTLARHLGAVAVVSGRPGRFLLDRLAPATGLRLFGLYGLEEVVDGDIRLALDLSVSERALGGLADELEAALPGVLLERKGHSIALHWRQHPEDEARIRPLSTRLALAAGFEVRGAKRSIEIAPPALPDKGSVVRLLSDRCARLAYAGDDLGDLAAFDALDELAAEGRTTVRIAVRDAESPEALSSRADWCCEGPAAFVAFLVELAAILGG